MWAVIIRDAPIIGIGRLSTDNRNRLITMPVSADCYLLCIMMALDTEIIYFFKFEWTTQILVFIVIYANSANMLIALFSYAIICYIIQWPLPYRCISSYNSSDDLRGIRPNVAHLTTIHRTLCLLN